MTLFDVTFYLQTVDIIMQSLLLRGFRYTFFFFLMIPALKSLKGFISILMYIFRNFHKFYTLLKWWIIQRMLKIVKVYTCNWVHGNLSNRQSSMYFLLRIRVVPIVGYVVNNCFDWFIRSFTLTVHSSRDRPITGLNNWVSSLCISRYNL